MSTNESGPHYGPWALVAGASEGLGEAFAEALAARGYSLILLARRADVLAALAERLRTTHPGSEVVVHAMDLAAPDLAAQLEAVVGERVLGVAVYNAAFAPTGAFTERPLEDLLRAVDVNVRGPLVMARTLAPAMAARGRGALVLMSSLAGWQGSPRLATYAATKAFNTVLAEGLWGELRARGVDVLVTTAGAVRTPGYQRSSTRDAPGILSPGAVAERTLRALGRGPVLVPGVVNKLAAYLVGRILPRRLAVAVMDASTRDVS